ncbi:MAG: hypothetical protein AAGD04_13890 [Pseudomonadota bacterium]
MALFRSVALAALLFWSPAGLTAEPLFPNSVVSNNLDFIKTNDQSVYRCLAFQGRERAEMPDKRKDQLFADNTYIFEAKYTDGTTIGLWVHPDFGSQANARKSALPVAQAVGKLPTFMRATLNHVVVHKGDETAFAEDQGHFFVMYSDNIRTRIRNNDLEETVFHESVHATLDAAHLKSRAWRKAQRADKGFVTEYAKDNSRKEDMAESALFAWAMLQHEGRLPASVEADVREVMPARLSFFEKLFLGQPRFAKVGPNTGC